MRAGEPGPVELERGTRGVQTRLDRQRTGPQAWRVMPRRPRSDARRLEPQAAQAGTAQEARYGYRDALMPRCGAEAARKEPSQAAVARGIKAGTCRDASGKRGQGEVGMDASQGRTWPGWHHPRALSLMAVRFLLGATQRGQQLTPAVTLPQVRYGLRVLLLEGEGTRGTDSMGRQVSRPLLRNELARCSPHRTRKCMPPRKLCQDIQ